MFEITGDDIAALNDGDLRSLVARLCETELRSRNLPTSAVTAGGNQDAADGGVDVRVALAAGTEIDGFVPRRNTVFQVKVPDMPRSAILAEMKPAGNIRPAIAEQANRSGAYIIISSTGSTSDTALHDRRAAMAEAVASLPNAGSLALDFYDRERIATWVRGHPGLIPWVRQRIGKHIQGWQSYGGWAHVPEGAPTEYLLDDSLRVRTGEKDDGDGLGAVAGINRIRSLLRNPGKVVRLVGLSGVGKTRLVQALFDERVGEGAVDSSLAIYTNLADGPDPQPVGLASDLIASKSRAILVIDNCPPDLHRRLSELCRSAGSLLSVITVEYDIRDDQQEGTEVFKLEPSSKELIEKLIRGGYPSVSQVDAGTIATFSGGNARVAMALAATVGKSETITGLKDEELFRRLFQQGHQHDDGLLRIAQACALVYSFQGEQISGAEAELPRLGALVGKSAEEVFAGVAELKRRDLAQKRNVWRAILPHAIANRLAALALQNIPFQTIEAQLITGAPDRLVKSFSRRLGYLPESREAVRIVESWLAPGGLLGDVTKSDARGEAMFKNVAPVAPEATLAALERALAGTAEGAAKCKQFTRLVRSIAYDAKLFERSASLLVNVLETEQDSDNDSASNVFASLFFIYLSGTHATIEQRLVLIEALLRSSESKRQALGLSALRNALSTGPFTSSYDFEFGTRSRDHGYRPRTQAEIQHWFGAVVAFAEGLIASSVLTSEVQAMFASAFRGMWNAGVADELDRVFRKIAEKQFWREGWIAARQTQQYDAKKMTPEAAERLSELEKSLRPQRLTDKVRTFVLSGKAGRLDLDEWEEDENISRGLERRAALVHELGQETAKDKAAFSELRPELFAGGGGQLPEFGRGLATAAEKPVDMWKELVQGYGEAGARVSEQVLGGFLDGLRKRDAIAANAALDDAVEHATLGRVFPILQAAVPIDEQGVKRTTQSLALGKVPAETYRVLAYGRASDPIPAADLRDTLVAIAQLEGGLHVACDIHFMRMHSDKEKKAGAAPELLETGRHLLSQMEFKEQRDREDYRLKDIAKACLRGKDGAPIATALCQRLRAAAAAGETVASFHDDFLSGVFATQPVAALDGLLSGNAEEQKQGLEVISDIRPLHRNPLDAIPPEQLMEWCDGAPDLRYPLAGSIVSFSQHPEDSAATEWSPAVLKLLEKAPSRVEFLKRVVRQLRPMSWSGSRAAIMEANAKLLDQLLTHPDANVVGFVKEEKARLAGEVERERIFETEHDRDADERFE